MTSTNNLTSYELKNNSQYLDTQFFAKQKFGCYSSKPFQNRTLHDVLEFLEIPEKIAKTVSSYVPEDNIDLTNAKVLKTYLGQKFCQDDQYVASAKSIANRISEVGIRPIKDTKYGQAFPMNPEILAHAMKLAKDEIVLEIAGASGENALLLAFSDARKVYMNDIEPREVEAFEKLKSELPREIRKKLETIEGNCFDCLDQKPELANQVGLILCRNLIHFFTDQQQADFFKLLKKLLKPNGQVIFTVNSQYPLLQNRKIFEENPDATCFTTTQCLVTDYTKGTMPLHVIYQGVAPAPKGDEASNQFIARYIYEKNQNTDFKWKVDQAEFQKLPQSVRTEVSKACLENKAKITPITRGSVRVLTNTLRIYNEKNLSELLEQHGFEVESTYIVGKDGHLIGDKDPFGIGQQVGIIVRSNPQDITLQENITNK